MLISEVFPQELGETLYKPVAFGYAVPCYIRPDTVYVKEDHDRGRTLIISRHKIVLRVFQEDCHKGKTGQIVIFCFIFVNVTEHTKYILHQNSCFFQHLFHR